MPPAAKRIPSADIPADESPFAGMEAGPIPITSQDILDAAPERPKSAADTELIIKALTTTYTTIGMGLGLVAPNDGRIIASQADTLAESWREILDNDRKLRNRMKKVIQGSGWGTVISAHLLVAMPIAMAHRSSWEHLISRKPTEQASDGSQQNA